MLMFELLKINYRLNFLKIFEAKRDFKLDFRKSYLTNIDKNWLKYTRLVKKFAASG